ncbi:MAG: IS256 family transposase [Actinobacteria bacterium]|nr:IS256 family transposase [Actinomycetota bacterium]
METVSREQVATSEAIDAIALPPRVQKALGELVGSAKEGLLALSVGVGLGVLAELMEEEVDEVVGAKGRHDPERTAVRHGHESGEVTLGGRRVPVERPRVRSADGMSEMPLCTYQHFASRDPLSRLVLEQMLAGVSTRRFERTREPVGSEVEAAARSTSRSAVSREFVARTRENLLGLMSRRLDDVRLAVLMLDGIELKGRCCLVCLGITSDGVKIPLGLWDGSTENATVARELLSNLVSRGLDTGQGVLLVIDGAKALRKAIDEVLGPVPVQRCVRHKERNVLDHLPERDRPPVKQRLRRAWARDDHERALRELRSLAAELERSHPGAAASLREGMAETLTVTRLGVKGSLKRTLQSTNPCESMIEIVRRTSRNVKRWQSGDMCLRWTAAGMLEAERQFRKIIGYRGLATLALAVERDLHPHPTQEVLLTLA